MRALLLMVLYSIRSERQLMEQLDYNLLYRWFVGMNLDEAVWDVTVFTKNRERLMEGEVAERLLQAIVEEAGKRELLSQEHFTVDGTLIPAWANRRSFRSRSNPPKPGKGSGKDGALLLRDTHESTTDVEARLYKKSAASVAVPSYLGHVVIENRHALIVSACATQSGNAAEREAALDMLKGIRRADRITLGADRNYQEPVFLQALRARGITPHVAEYDSGDNVRKNSLREEERSDPGFAISQRKRKRVEEVFGWCKLNRMLQQVKLRGLRRVDALMKLMAAAHNLRRMQRLLYAW